MRFDIIRILLVEDNRDHADLITAQLSRKSSAFKIDIAYSADEALEITRSKEYDLLLADYNIGALRAFDLLNKLKERGIEYPTIILTGQGDEKVAQEAIQRGVAGYQIKSQVFNNPDLLVNAMFDTVEKARLSKALEEREELYRTLVNNMHDGVFVFRDDRLDFVNPTFCSTLGLAEAQIYKSNLYSLFSPEQRDAFKEMVEKAWKQKRTFERDFTMLGSPNNKLIYVTLSMSKCQYEGRPALIGTVKDITTQVGALRELENMLKEKEILSITDDLTGLKNRRFALQTLQTEVSRARRYPGKLSLIMLDLDEFKSINDKYGHLVGDETLRFFAKILREEIRETDIAARYGGDEFIVILPETNIEQAITLAFRIRDRSNISKIISDKNTEVSILVSLGVAQFDTKKDNINSLIRKADDNLLEAKKKGRNTVIS